MRSASAVSVRPKVTTSATSGCPLVRVPVLSNATARTLAAVSRNAPPFTSTPSRLARVIPLTMDTGVEITSAHGQLTTSTTSARLIHSAQAPQSAPVTAARSGGTTAIAIASAMTAGV